MKYLGSVKTIRKHFLSLISNTILLTGILLMIGAIGSMDMAVESGGSGIDLKTMLIGFVLTLIGFTLAQRRQNRDERENFRAKSERLYRITRRVAG